MRTDKKTTDNLDESAVLKIRHRTPKRGLATARFRANLGGFRVYLSVVAKESEQSKRRLTFTRREAEDIAQAATNLVETLKQNAFGEDPVTR